jgi:hypothetical protein
MDRNKDEAPATDEAAADGQSGAAVCVAYPTTANLNAHRAAFAQLAAGLSDQYLVYSVHRVLPLLAQCAAQIPDRDLAAKILVAATEFSRAHEIQLQAALSVEHAVSEDWKRNGNPEGWETGGDGI